MSGMADPEGLDQGFGHKDLAHGYGMNPEHRPGRNPVPDFAVGKTQAIPEPVQTFAPPERANDIIQKNEG
jgi:hypothetical protein